jgi:hypothetical protein
LALSGKNAVATARTAWVTTANGSASGDAAAMLDEHALERVLACEEHLAFVGEIRKKVRSVRPARLAISATVVPRTPAGRTAHRRRLQTLAVRRAPSGPSSQPSDDTD